MPWTESPQFALVEHLVVAVVMLALTESRIRVLDDTPFAVLFHSSITLQRHLTILNVEILQTTTIIRNALHPSIGNHITIFETQFLQIRATFGQCMQASIRHIAFSNVQCPESWTRMGQNGDGIIADCFTASSIQITQFVASTSDHFEASVRHLIAFGHREVSQGCSQLGQFVEREIGYVDAVRYAKLTQTGAETWHEFQTDIWNDIILWVFSRLARVKQTHLKSEDTVEDTNKSVEGNFGQQF